MTKPGRPAAQAATETPNKPRQSRGPGASTSKTAISTGTYGPGAGVDIFDVVIRGGNMSAKLRDPSGSITRVYIAKGLRGDEKKRTAVAEAVSGTVHNKVVKATLLDLVGARAEPVRRADVKDADATVTQTGRKGAMLRLDGPLDWSRITLTAADPDAPAEQERRLAETLAGLGLAPVTRN